MTLKPRLTLYDLFGPGFIYNSRASYHNNQWLPDLLSQDCYTGTLIPIAGKIPFPCHRDVVHPECLAILKEAGLPLAEHYATYESEQSYYSLLNRWQKGSEKLVINFPHLPHEVDEQKYWIPPRLTAHFNNKKNLKLFVSSPHIPHRVVRTPNEILNLEQTFSPMPFVVKAAIDEPGGGGLEIVLCREQKDLEQANQLFSSCSEIIVEEFLNIKKNYCVQFARTTQGKTIYLGASEQIISEEGKYAGNWITSNDPPNKVVELATKIIDQAVSKGYVGIAGIDIVITEDNRILVIDLNFRQNGSTGPLLLRDSIFQNWEANVLKLGKWKWGGSFKDFEKKMKRLINHKRVVPLSIYKSSDPTLPYTVYMTCLLVGETKEGIGEVEEEMKKSGFIM